MFLIYKVDPRNTDKVYPLACGTTLEKVEEWLNINKPGVVKREILYRQVFIDCYEYEVKIQWYDLPHEICKIRVVSGIEFIDRDMNNNG